MDPEQLAVDTIRALTMDAVQAANSGHPGMPMGMADLAVLDEKGTIAGHAGDDHLLGLYRASIVKARDIDPPIGRGDHLVQRRDARGDHLGRGGPGQAEIEDLHCPARGDLDVGRLEVAVDDALLVGGAEAGEDRVLGETPVTTFTRSTREGCSTRRLASAP